MISHSTDGHVQTLRQNRRLRRVLLLTAAPFILIFSAAGVAILYGYYYNNLGISQYNNGLYAQSIASYKQGSTFLFTQAYKTNFDIGDSQYQLGDYTNSEASFKTALKAAGRDPKCLITLNIALSEESQADQFFSSAVYSKAIPLYWESYNLLNNNPACNQKYSTEIANIYNSIGASQGLTDGGSNLSNTGNFVTSAPSATQSQTVQDLSQSAARRNQSTINQNANPPAAGVPYGQEPY